MTFQIQPLDDSNKTEWGEFCLSNEDAWFWHTLDYENYIRELYPASKSYSFLVSLNNSIIAIVPLVAVNKDGNQEFSHGGWSLPFAAVSQDIGNHREEVFHFIFRKIDELAIREGIKRISISVSAHQSRLFREFQEKNWLLSYRGFIDCSEYTSVIDLNRTEKEIIGTMRKRVKQYVRNLESKLQVDIFNQNNITKEIIDDYGRVSLLDSSQNISDLKMWTTYTWLKLGHGILTRVISIEANIPVGYLFVLTFKDSAFDYEVAVADEFKPLRISHTMKYHATMHLKSIGLRFYELGVYNETPKLHRIPSGKHIGITKFKSGFSDRIFNFYVAERFYCKEYFHKVFIKRLKDFEEANFPLEIPQE